MDVTVVGRDDRLPRESAPAGVAREDWVEVLGRAGPDRDDAVRALHGLLLGAARHQVWQMRNMLTSAGEARFEEIANQAADEAVVALLAKLPTFEGRSRFTTWAYKFAILQAATEVRRLAWRDREVPLDDSAVVPEPGPSPEQYAEAKDLAEAVRSAIDSVLTRYQRQIVVALVVDDVPVDVLADRLGTTRGALYKTLHEARGRLRARLRATGHLGGPDPQAGRR